MAHRGGHEPRTRGLKVHHTDASNGIRPPSGPSIIRFRAAGWTEMAWHLYQWGDTVEVIAPEELSRMGGRGLPAQRLLPCFAVGRRTAALAQNATAQVSPFAGGWKLSPAPRTAKVCHMCGRYSLTTPPEALQRLFRLAPPLPNLAPRYNIAPTQEAPVVGLRKDRDTRGLAMLRWGLCPSDPRDRTAGST